MHRAYRVRN